MWQSAACRWLRYGSAVAVSGLQVAQLCRAAVEVGLVLGLELEVRVRARVRKSAIARRGWWRWVLCGVWVVYEWCYVVVEWCYVVGERCMGKAPSRWPDPRLIGAGGYLFIAA